MTLVGYHGTKADLADKIFKEQNFLYSASKSWLGKGVYFFEEDVFFDGYTNAKRWCNSAKFTPYKIVKVEINSDSVFDMVEDNKAQKQFASMYTAMYKKHLESGYPSDTFTPSTVFNIISKDGNIEVIRAIADAKSYKDLPRGYVIILPQIQLCVCNKKESVIKIVDVS